MGIPRRKKEPTVKLVVPKYGKEQEFTIPHAERILDMGTHLNGGWELPEDSAYRYDEEYGLRLKDNKGDTAKTR